MINSEFYAFKIIIKMLHPHQTNNLFKRKIFKKYFGFYYRFLLDCIHCQIKYATFQ